MASAIWAVLEQHRAALAGLLGASVHQDGGLLAVCHPRLGWPWLNYACPVAPPAAGAPGRAAARLVAAGRMPAFVLPAPPGDPGPMTAAQVRQLLPAAARRERQAVYVAAAPPPASPEGGGPRIWTVPAGQAARWAELMLGAFGVPVELRPGLARAWAGAPAAARPGEAVRLYLAELGGEPAGTGLLYIDADGTAGLYGGGVAPAHRRCGVAGALVRRRLADAFALGARRAVTHTAPDGPLARIWDRLGLVPTYGIELWY